jgi:hypothetical protein
LKRRFRAGRGTPDSAGGWLRGPDTPLSGSADWLESCGEEGGGSGVIVMVMNFDSNYSKCDINTIFAHAQK